MKSRKVQTALERFKAAEADGIDCPIERLRFFCSCAMTGQDWLDVEPFFDDLMEMEQNSRRWSFFRFEASEETIGTMMAAGPNHYDELIDEVLNEWRDDNCGQEYPA